ncbi:MAG: hypothetical protein JWO59_329 [Chloroflexi bacterium]|nr:hypothetical protein [Chloroflexota bacterium]
MPCGSPLAADMDTLSNLHAPLPLVRHLFPLLGSYAVVLFMYTVNS